MEEPEVEHVGQVYLAYHEDYNWDGSGTFADMESAQRYSQHFYLIDECGWDEENQPVLGELTWTPSNTFSTLMLDGEETCVHVIRSPIWRLVEK